MEERIPPVAYTLDISGDHPLVFRILDDETRRVSLGKMDNWGIPRNLNRGAEYMKPDDCSGRNWLNDLYDFLPEEDQTQAGNALWMVGCSPEWEENGRMDILHDMLRSAGFGMPVPVCSLDAARAGSGLDWKEMSGALQIQISGENTVAVWMENGEKHFRVSTVGAHALDMLILAKNLERNPGGRSVTFQLACDDDFALEQIRRSCFLREEYLYRQPEPVSRTEAKPWLYLDEEIIVSAAEDPVQDSLESCLDAFVVDGGWKQFGSGSWKEALSGFFRSLNCYDSEMPVILTGMTARLDSVVSAAEKVFPARFVMIEQDPALTVSKGLCRMAGELLPCIALRDVCEGFAEEPRQQEILEGLFGEWVERKSDKLKDITSWIVDAAMQDWIDYEVEAAKLADHTAGMVKKALQYYFAGDMLDWNIFLGRDFLDDWKYLQWSHLCKINDSFQKTMAETGQIWQKELLADDTEFPLDYVSEENQKEIIRKLTEDYCIRKGSPIFSKWPKLSLWNPVTMSRRLYFEMLDIFGTQYQRFRKENLDDVQHWLVVYLGQEELQQQMITRCQARLREILKQKQSEWIREMDLPVQWLHWCGFAPEQENGIGRM